MSTPTGVGLVHRFRRGCRAPVNGLASYLHGAPYLVKWIILGCLIGSIAGLGAVAFVRALMLCTELFLHGLGGYQIPTVAKEGGLAGSSGFTRPWAIPLIVGLGALLASVLVRTLAREAEGHGTDAAIDAVHRRPRHVRIRAVAVKIVASAITLGSGGSGGREGPTAQISSGFGSLLTRTLNLSHRDGRIAVSIGIGAGIGSIFSAPLGGALLSAEILYREDTEVGAIVPSFIASGIGYTIFGAIQGFEPMFGFVAADYNFTNPAQLAWYALIGVVAGGIGLLYSRTFYGIKALFARLPVPPVLSPMIGGLLTGTLALAVPQVLGTGYGWIQQSFGQGLSNLPLILVLALPFAKILATSLSIGSGGSGGIFGPGMVIGAFTGAAIWRLLEPVAPAVPADAAPFVLVGMMACFGPICRAPVAVMLMVAEMSGSITTLVPALVSVGLSYLIVHHFGETIYRSQLLNRTEVAAEEPGNDTRAPETSRVTEFMDEAQVVCSDKDSLNATIDTLDSHGLPGAPVTDESGRFVGVISKETLEEAAASAGEETIDGYLLAPAPAAMNRTDGLDAALDALLDSGMTWLSVLDERHRVAGVLTAPAVVHGYGAELSTAQRETVHGDTVLIEIDVESGSTLAGTPLREAPLPDRAVVMSLHRGPQSLASRPGGVLHPGDRLTILTTSDAATEIGTLAASGDANTTPRPDSAGEVHLH